MRTRVGYAGGAKQHPTYRSLGDHTEALQVDYDPARISFAQLLEVFWQEHNPCGQPWSTQYKAILFYAGAAQQQAAEASAAAIGAERGASITTEVVPLGEFWPAEDYHQKYALRGEPQLARQVLALGDGEAAFRDSPVAAKLNAWCAGDLSRDDLAPQLRELGFELVGAGELRQLVPTARPR